MGESTEMEVIKYGFKEVRIYPRKDGRYTLRWFEDNKRQVSTRKNLTVARSDARTIAMKLHRDDGEKTVTSTEAKAIEYIREELPSYLGIADAMKMLQRLIKSTRSENELERIVQRAEREAEQHDSLITIEEVHEYLEKFYTRGKKFSKHTWRGLNDELKAFMKAYPDFLLIDIDHEFLEDWCERGDIAEQTFNNRLTNWRTIMNRCIKWGKLPKMVETEADKVEKRKAHKKHPAIFTVKEVSRSLEYLSNLEDKKFMFGYVVAAFSGMRPSEVCRLQKRNFEFEIKSINANSEICHKLKEERYVPISDQLKSFLNIIWSDLPDSGVIITPKQWNKISLNLRGEGIIEKWHEDVLRHSYISYELSVTKDINKIAEDCGNSADVIREKYKRPIHESVGRRYRGLMRMWVQEDREV